MPALWNPLGWIVATLLAVSVSVLLLLAHNRLQRGAQRVKERAANLRAAIRESGRSTGAERLQPQREAYNAAVRSYNSLCLSLPTALVARLLGFAKAPYLELEAVDSPLPAPGAGDVAYMYLRPGGVPQGPVRFVSLRAMVADGRLAPVAVAAPVGTDDWQPVADVIGSPGVSQRVCGPIFFTSTITGRHDEPDRDDAFR